MKRFAKIALIALMIVICVFAVVACNKTQNKPSGNPTENVISISGSNMPQTVFVKGNDLDLSRGKLTVVKDGQTSEIALNSEGVTVEGYDKNSVGAQQLTVSYGGARTALTVNVVERMVAESADANDFAYVVGETFNKTKGMLRITKDDGNSFTANISDKRLTLNGFESETAGEKTVNVLFKENELELNGSFTVTVYAVDSVTLASSPQKRIYSSHEEKIDITGAVVNVRAGTISKSILVDDSMVSGYDPSVVTEENPKVTQVIEINYSGKKTAFRIEINLSDVTRVKNTAALLSSLDWSKDSAPAITKEQGEAAMKALQLFFGLNEMDKLIISKDEMSAVLRPAVVYGNEKVASDMANFDGLFDIDEGRLSIDCLDYAKTEQQFASILKLIEEDEDMFLYNDILMEALYQFHSTVLYGEEADKETTVADILVSVCPKEDIETALKKIDLMLKMHDALNGVSDSDDLIEHKEKIEQAAELMVQLGKLTLNEENTPNIFERYLFNTVSSWREDDEFYDIIYHYYYTIILNAENNDEARAAMLAIDSIFNLCLPKELEVYYQQNLNVLFESLYIVWDDKRPAINFDTLKYVIEYRRLCEIRENVFASEDVMILDLYDLFNMDSSTFINIQTKNFGIFDILGPAFGVSAFDDLWTEYIETMAAYAKSVGDENAKADADEKAEKLFENFIALTPELQAQFIASLNAYTSPELYPDDGTGRFTMFISMILALYNDIFPRNMLVVGEGEYAENGIVFEMFDALQAYILRNYEYEGHVDEDDPKTYLEVFLASVKKIERMYGELSVSDKALFDAHIKFFYDKLVFLGNLYNEDGEFKDVQISDEWKEQIEILKAWYEILSNYIIIARQDYTKYPVFVSMYEMTIEMFDSIMTSAPQEVKNLLIYANTDVFNDATETLETYLYQYRWICRDMLTKYPYYLTANGWVSIYLWNDYDAPSSSNLRQFMSSLVDFYAVAISNKEDVSLTYEQVKGALDGFSALTDEEKDIFVKLEGDGTFVYFQALREFFQEKCEDDVWKIAIHFIELEIGWAVDYSLEQFAVDFENIMNEYEALSDEDKKLFEATYNCYKSIYDEITAAVEAE